MGGFCGRWLNWAGTAAVGFCDEYVTCVAGRVCVRAHVCAHMCCAVTSVRGLLARFVPPIAVSQQRRLLQPPEVPPSQAVTGLAADAAMHSVTTHNSD
jgi:hypothetical protein